MKSILCGHNLDVLKDIEKDTVDIVITSPPYNFDMPYISTKDKVAYDVYFAALNEVWKECFRVLKPGGRLCVNVQPVFSDYIPTHHIISNNLLGISFLWKGEILWEKNNYNCKITAWGSWKSPSMPYLKYTWEFIEIFCKASQKHEGKSDKIDINADEFKKWIVARWTIAPEHRMKEFNHPAVFPEELVERLLKLFSFQDDLVLDPFNGVGTTTLVANRLKRNYIGIDISQEYCKTAQQRIEQDTCLPTI
jgi:site-specific DNA-methyltransferase (adenine-specific)